MLLRLLGSKYKAIFNACIPGIIGKRLVICGFVPFLTLSHFTAGYADSQLMITPTRIVFSEKMRSASVTIINNGDRPGTYRISMVNKRMTVDGKFEDVKQAEHGELFSDKMIRYSPRQVVLEPGKSQVVRLGLRKPSDLKEGEYRSHMLFRAIPEELEKNVESLVKPSNDLRVSLKAIVGISIPVIVRHGNTNAEVSIVSVQFKPRQVNEDRPHLLVELERTGNRSVYGDFLVEFITNDGERKVVSQAGGVAVYSPGTKRRIKLPITSPPGLELVNGSFQVFYRSPIAQGGKVLAEAQVRIP